MPMSDNRLTERVQAAVRAALHAPGHTHLLVACSGGGDSVCLAHAMATVAKREGWHIALGHVRHGVRADDGEDAMLVEQLARSLGVPIFVHSYPPASLAPNETALRQARYDALAEMAAAFQATAILTGHTRDDQAETVLLRLLRGAGVDGLAAIAPDAPFPVPLPGISSLLRVLRPLLALRRAELRAYCVAQGLAYHDDPTNDEPTYRRNWIRHTVLPLLNEEYPGAVDTLARTADLMREDADYLRAATDGVLDRCMVNSPTSAVTTLDRVAFTTEPIALQRRVLRTVFTRYANHAPRADQLEIVRRALGDGRTQIHTLGPVAFWPAYGHVTIGSEPDVIAVVRHRALQRHPLTRYDTIVPFMGQTLLTAADRVSRFGHTQFRLAVRPVIEAAILPGPVRHLQLPENATLALRNRRPGDTLRPSRGAKTRKLQDYLTEQGVPAALRDELPLLVLDDGSTAGSEIVAVIGYDIAAAFSATGGGATHMLTLHRLNS